jgi:hypothetical protein
MHRHIFIGELDAPTPVCCIVTEGGPGTLETARDAIQQDTPVIVVENTGRMADVLAVGYLRSRML